MREPLLKRRPDRLIIAITGGSVAWQLSVGGEELIRSLLHESPALRDREIIILRLGMSGFKQPQQLQAISYVLALGG